MNHPTMTNRTSTTLTGKEIKKRAGAVKGIDETDSNDMAFKWVTMVVFSLCCEYSLFLLIFCLIFTIPPPLFGRHRSVGNAGMMMARGTPSSPIARAGVQ